MLPRHYFVWWHLLMAALRHERLEDSNRVTLGTTDWAASSARAKTVSAS